jgi:hypothetical protein
VLDLAASVGARREVEALLWQSKRIGL